MTAEGTLPLKIWLEQLFDSLQTLAVLLDGEKTDYQAALAHWRKAIENPDLTLSGQVLQNVIHQGQDHGQWVMTLAQQYYQYFVDYPLSSETIAQYQAEAVRSLKKQAELEAAQSKVAFDDYLKEYFGMTS